MDRPGYKVRLADSEYWREQISCQYAYPVHTDARVYVRAIGDGDYENADFFPNLKSKAEKR